MGSETIFPRDEVNMELLQLLFVVELDIPL